MANKLFAVGYLREAIQHFAITNLRRACGLHEDPAVEAAEAGAAAAPDQQLARYQMHLFLALCAQRHDLLHALLHAYVQVRAHVPACPPAHLPPPPPPPLSY